jgi:putative membrane protein
MSVMRAERVRFPKRATWLTLVGVMLVPVVIGGLLTWALWDPTKRLDRITAAVVNLDEPVNLNGQTVPLGRQLAAALVTGKASFDPEDRGDTTAGAAAATAKDGTVADVSGTDSPSSFVWVLSDAKDAASGLTDGRYGAVVTIPASFSAAATSSAGAAADATQATLRIQTSDRSRPVDAAISAAIAQAAAQVTGTQLTTSFLDNVLVSFGTLHDQLGQAADGATKLADGATQLGGGAQGVADGTGALASGVGKVASGAQGLAGGLGTLSSGAGSLASGVGKVSGGASGLAAGLDQMAAQTATSAQQAAAGVPGAQQFAAGLQAAATGVTGPGGLADSAGQLATGATALSGGLTQMLTQLEQLAQVCRTSGDVAPVYACSTLVGALQAQQGQAPVNGQPTVTASATQLVAGLTALHGGLTTGDAAHPPLGPSLTQLAAGGTQLASGAQQSADGLATLSSYLGTLASGAHDLASGASQAASGASGLASGAAKASSGAAQLASGAADAQSGAAQLASGAAQVASGAQGLAGGATDLSGGLGQAVEKLPSYTKDEASTLAAVVASPVAVEGVSQDILGSSSVPYLLAVALWLGGLVTFLVLAPVTRDSLGSTRSSLRLALGAFTPAAAVGVVQALLLTAVMAFSLDLSASGWAAFAAITALAAVSFAAVNQALAALLGGIGRFVAMLVAVVALATAVISTVPVLLDQVAGLLPTAAVLDALRAVVLGTSGGWGGAVALVLWGVAGLGVTALAVGRTRVVEVGRLARWARAA